MGYNRVLNLYRELETPPEIIDLPPIVPHRVYPDTDLGLFLNDLIIMGGPTKHSEAYVSLHTAEPTTGNLSEATYAGYARVPLSQTIWKVTKDSISNDNKLEFKTCTGRSDTVTHVALWRNDKLVLHMHVGKLLITLGVTPFFSPGQFVITIN